MYNEGIMIQPQKAIPVMQTPPLVEQPIIVLLNDKAKSCIVIVLGYTSNLGYCSHASSLMAATTGPSSLWSNHTEPFLLQADAGQTKYIRALHTLFTSSPHHLIILIRSPGTDGLSSNSRISILIRSAEKKVRAVPVQGTQRRSTRMVRTLYDRKNTSTYSANAIIQIPYYSSP
ncbi:hypothetical protein CI102_10108 [Trichoderma harzianum]|uniref:Uncharacterized protein n=1 Tax=Trichoderma harzianum CBS 226.95 TaxID=983964 RepID=A0A2T4ACK2_TRIHA|nr:hypothetical protein M431DRAFT_482008 [Trichoderma harzianum CBS 226.95]PKK43441.1 hypothetical protein CI102_10108 [Trichoderma harzianum]PTB54810.1 hypothetical protein M431DRAFT_482008 [Trichoderma harzianum CBS 226.95]